MKPQRILHVVGAMNRGGAETMIMAMYRSLDRDKYQFDFLEFSSGESDYSEEIRSLGGRIFHCNWDQSPFRVFSTMKGLSKVISDEGPFMAVHSHVLFASGIVLAAAASAGVNVRVAHSHNTSTQDSGIRELVYQFISRSTMRMFTTGIAACTQAAGHYLFGHRWFSRTGIVIPNAVDTCEFRPAPLPEREKLRASYGLTSNTMVLASVARMELVKNHRFLIDLAADLDAEGVDFTLLLVGDGSLREELESEVASRGLDDRIQFWGLRTDIPVILRCVDALLMPSHFEGLPVALVEAQASGVRCVVSDNISRDADLGAGLLSFLPISSPEPWTKLLLTEKRMQVSSESIQHALSERGYSIDSALDKCFSLYSS